MRPSPWMMILLALVAVAAGAQTLDCPPGTAGTSRPCDTFHYHVLMYRPDRKPAVELWALGQFASIAACERSRQAYIDRNLAVVDYFKRVRNEQSYEPDRAGQCHCDRSIEPGNPRFLSEAMRVQQLRLAEDVRQLVREKLIDAGVTTDSDLVRGLTAQPTTNALLGGAKLTPLPQPAAAASAANAAGDLKSTRIDTNKPAVTSLDLPLVEIPVPGLTPAPATEVASADGGTPAVVPAPAPVPAPETPAATPPPPPTAPPPTPPPPTPPTPPVTPEDRALAEETAEQFIKYETDRALLILNAADKVTDEKVRSRIEDALGQRLQLLPNLRALIQASGVRSRLATMARDARTEEERLTLIARIFGNDIKPHWAPKDAADVVLDARPELESEPERILRDTSGRYTEAQKKRALYTLLAKSTPTEEQQLWLTTVVDGFLR